MKPNATAEGTPRSDPFAAALGNASLLGIGYLLLGRIGLAIAGLCGTAALLAAVGLSEQPAWFWRIVLGLWWMLQIGHAWWQATRRAQLRMPPPPTPLRAVGESPRESLRTQRFFAATAFVLVLVPAFAMRAEAVRIEQAAVDVYGWDDCTAAEAVEAAFTVRHRIADGMPVARAETVQDACGDLAEAGDHLSEAETADGVAGAFNRLENVLDEAPQLRDEADNLVDGFTADLSNGASCDAVEVADWLANQPPDNGLRSRAAAVVPEVMPKALLKCAQSQFDADEVVFFEEALAEADEARAAFQRLLDEYPDHPLAAEAALGVDAVDAVFELEELTTLTTSVYGAPPEYCERPAPYRGAAPYEGSGPHPTMLFGESVGADALPKSWTTGIASEAVLVICAELSGLGAHVETCAYQGGHSIAFHRQQIALRVFEVRTGELVDTRTIEIGGTCPSTVYYYQTPPEKMAVESSGSDYIDAYRPVIDP